MQAQEGEDELAAAALIPAWFSRQLKLRKSIEAREWYLPGRW